MPGRDLFLPGVIGLALLQVIFPCRALLGCLPELVAFQDGLPVDEKRTQQCKVLAVIICESVNADGSAVPAVAQGDDELVFTGLLGSPGL